MRLSLLLPIVLLYPFRALHAADVKVACIGNSITAAYGYPETLGKLLGAGYALENDGVSSTTAIRRGSYPYWTKGKLANVFAFKPNWITIKLGTNDSRPEFWGQYSGEFKRDYLALVDTLSTLSSKPRIWIVLPTPTWRTEDNRPNDANIMKMIPILKEIAAERKLEIIDCHTPLLNFKEDFKTDYIHPNARASDTIAHVIYRALAKTTALAGSGQAEGSGTRIVPATAIAPRFFDFLGRSGSGLSGNAVLASPPQPLLK